MHAGEYISCDDLYDDDDYADDFEDGGPEDVEAIVPRLLDSLAAEPSTGRGRAAATDRLIAEMVAIAKAIQPCSVRALAYQLFNRKLIPSMALANTKKVSRLCVIAREEGDIPWEWIVDSTRQEEIVSTWADPAAYAVAVQQSYRKNKWESQPKHISVWSEKSTVEGTLRPVLQEYEVPFQVLHGWSGATPVMDAVRPIGDATRPR